MRSRIGKTIDLLEIVHFFSEQIKHLAKFPIIHAPSFVISSFGNIGEVYVKEIRYFIQLEYSAKEQVREEIFWGEL